MMIDILSETLMKMKLKAYFSGALDAGGHWAVESPSFDGFKLIVVLKGECWISIEGLPGKYHLKQETASFLPAENLLLSRKIYPSKEKFSSTSSNGQLRTEL